MRRTAAAAVLVVVLVGAAAAAQPSWMDALVSGRTLVQQGEWWRAVTPVLVQPSGVPALAFLCLGAVALLPPLPARLPALLVALAAGVGWLAVISWVNPTVSSGGSSDLVAALVGSWLVELARRPSRWVTSGPGVRWWSPDGRWWAVLATGYAAFFAVYLVLLPVGAGPWVAPLGGDAAVAAAVTVVVRWPAAVRCVSVGLAVCGMVMAAQLDGHGVGILVGVLAGCAQLSWRRLKPQGRAWLRPVSGLVLVAALWGGWTQLYGVTLQVGGADQRQPIGLVQCLVVTAAAFAVTAAANRLTRSTSFWQGLPLGPICGVITVLTCLGPLDLAADPSSTAALVSLHLATGGTALWMIAGHARLHPCRRPGGRTSSGHHGGAKSAGRQRALVDDQPRLRR